jgi:hypothetical protein
MNLESELKAVLRRVDPPPGFGDRVMKRVAAGFSRPAGGLKAAATRALAAAGLIAIALGGWGMHATLRARNELLTAMRIASEKVAHAQQEVNRR